MLVQASLDQWSSRCLLVSHSVEPWKSLHLLRSAAVDSQKGLTLLLLVSSTSSRIRNINLTTVKDNGMFQAKELWFICIVKAKKKPEAKCHTSVIQQSVSRYAVK